MKWFKFVFSLMVLAFGFNILLNDIIVYGAEEDFRIITFEELSVEDKEFFLKQEYSEDDVFFEQIITEESLSQHNSPAGVSFLASVVGSTKRDMSYRARTDYVISVIIGGNMRQVDLQTVATSGDITRRNSTSKTLNAKRAELTTHILYHGPAAIFNFKGLVQITHSKGVAGQVISKQAGAVTLGFGNVSRIIQ